MRHLKSYAFMLLTAFVMFSCGDDYDDTALRNDVNDLTSRVEKLEAWCTTVNGQISSLQGLVSALEANDYVTGVSPVTVDGKTGYTITFTKSEAITIFDGVDGKNGADGTTPVIGVDKFTDGLYYWTVKNGDAKATWMLDASGNKIRTTGDAGKTPKLSVAADTDGKVYWQVDGQFLKDAAGKNVPATGDKGAQGEQGAQGEKGDAVFAKVDTKNPDYVEFTLVGGEVFKLQRADEVKIFDAFTTYRVNPAKSELVLALNVKKGEYTVLKAELTTSKGMSVAIVKATRAVTEPWGVALTEPTFKADGTIDANGKVIFIFPEGTSEGDKALLKVIVIDNNGIEHALTRVIEYSTRVDVESINVDAALALDVNAEATLTATVLPAAASQNVAWASADDKIATVTADGKVKGIAAGTVIITATSADNAEKKATCTVTVSNVAVKEVKLDATAALTLDGTLKLAPSFVPANATNQAVTWKSSDEAVVTVATDGTMTGKKVGTATITVTTADGGKTANCVVTVTEAPVSLVNCYYYSDGTYSAILDKSKTCIGIIIEEGRADADECVYMQKDGTTPMTEIHGYVLALNDANDGNNCKWGVNEKIGTGTSLEESFYGYEDTQKIKQYATTNNKDLQTDFPATYYATTGYEIQHAAPNSSSGWFLPSYNLGLLWAKNATDILKVIQKIPGYENYEWENGYWSTTEFATRPETMALYIDVISGGSTRKNKDAETAIRSFLVF